MLRSVSLILVVLLDMAHVLQMSIAQSRASCQHFVCAGNQLDTFLRSRCEKRSLDFLLPNEKRGCLRLLNRQHHLLLRLFLLDERLAQGHVVALVGHLA